MKSKLPTKLRVRKGNNMEYTTSICGHCAFYRKFIGCGNENFGDATQTACNKFIRRNDKRTKG